MPKLTFVTVILSVVAVLAGTPAVAEGPPRIGYLTFSPLLEKPSPERAGFIQGLREHGYVDGRNIAIEYRSAEGDLEALPFVAEELVSSGVKLVVTAGYHPIKALQDATRTLPIVILFGADPDGSGFAESLARPGGNITGMSQQNRELGVKRLELLREVVPGMKRVAVLWDSSNPVMIPEWEATKAAAHRLGIQVISADGAGQPSFEPVFDRLRKQRPDALITFVDLRMASYRQIIPEFALKQRLPAIYGLSAFVENGGLMSYAPDFADLSRRSASYVDKILRGANPAELPIQQPVVYNLVVNLKTARKLGIKVPNSILQRANKVIE